MPKDNNTAKPGMKVVAIAASAVLVAALAATGVLAYGQNNTGATRQCMERRTLRTQHLQAT